MKSSKMLVVFLALFVLAGSVFGAGVDNYDSLSGSINLPFLHAYWGGSNQTYNDTARSSGWLTIETLNPIDYGSWSFYTLANDPSMWFGQFTTSGSVGAGLPVTNMNNSGNLNLGEISIFESSNLWSYSDKETGLPWNVISGDLSVSPSQLLYSNFNYEIDKNYYGESYWLGSYHMSGQFVASTPEEARAMGELFVRPTAAPEPGSLILLASSLVGFAFYYRERRRTRG